MRALDVQPVMHFGSISGINVDYFIGLEATRRQSPRPRELPQKRSATNTMATAGGCARFGRSNSIPPRSARILWKKAAFCGRGHCR